MVLLTAVLVPMSVTASSRISGRESLYYALILWLQAGLFGTFCALNFFHWFLFWELSLVPAFFLVRLWGGAERVAAANRFFLYTMVGSVTLLLAFVAVYLATGRFDFVELAELARDGELGRALARSAAPGAGWLVWLVFWGAFLGFAVKMPLVPFHTWLPVTYAAAPIGTTMLLTGAMSKMGAYAFARILLPIFPDQIRGALPVLLGLAVLSIVFSASVALAQRDLRRLLAYSSINHLGYCFLGLAALFSADDAVQSPLFERTAALNGVFVQMFNHGLTAAALFWMVGLLEQRSGGWRDVEGFGGLRKPMPVFCGFMGIALFSSLGLPGLNGFVGEFLIFKGVFPLSPWAAVAALPGLMLTAVFILRVLQRVFFGPTAEKWAGLADLSVKERVCLFPAIALMLILGVYPQALVGIVNGTSAYFAQALPF
jgi:NADH-quinone oxidoreductase subunit M